MSDWDTYGIEPGAARHFVLQRRMKAGYVNPYTICGLLDGLWVRTMKSLTPEESLMDAENFLISIIITICFSMEPR